MTHNPDQIDIGILYALSYGKMSLLDIAAWVQCAGKVQFIASRLGRLRERKWIEIAADPESGSRRIRTLTRSGRMALKRFGNNK